MTEDFALIDFALTARAPAEVAEAIGQVRAARPATPAPEAPARRGILSRLLGRGGTARNASSGGPKLRIQPADTLAPPPLARIVLADMGFASNGGPVRLTGPLGAAGLTLIEFREGDGDTSGFCEALSKALKGDEIFYFRHSGSRHPGAHFAFHVYQDGRVTRRAVSVSKDGAIPEARWDGADSGMPHPLETDSLPAPGTANSEIMTPVRQSIILEALGLDPEYLFAEAQEPGLVTLELSEDAGGRPLSEVNAIVREQLHPASPELEDDEAQAELPLDQPAGDTETSHAPSEEPQEPNWEEEVTGLLVEAVEAALPADQQVAWLDQLTERLVGGDIDGALAEAHRMIRAGDRSEQDKVAAAIRLAELFGRGE
ncbi:hypothetical protein [Aliiruegeria lutimaris]|uniref:Uncharacterized protein n=1 Tax=Aliiruegeria lutimaris TaxID=571298 RepID=A0A1G8TIH9_9RHOB|nr:hypothetical protein [Aliiruegeria lutimaris]SDJ41406.1 hypothetical protein SAMN04488026_101718 [Aliiruegeria lutimaris]